MALNVTVAPLSDVVILGEHVLVTVCELAFVPVPPHVVGALTVPVLGVIVTEPLPLPAKVRTQLRADAWYGPMIGPPPGAPAGTTSSVDMSVIARARFRRPFPV